MAHRHLWLVENISCSQLAKFNDDWRSRNEKLLL